MTFLPELSACMSLETGFFFGRHALEYRQRNRRASGACATGSPPIAANTIHFAGGKLLQFGYRMVRVISWKLKKGPAPPLCNSGGFPNAGPAAMGYAAA